MIPFNSTPKTTYQVPISGLAMSKVQLRPLIPQCICKSACPRPTEPFCCYQSTFCSLFYCCRDVSAPLVGRKIQTDGETRGAYIEANIANETIRDSISKILDIKLQVPSFIVTESLEPYNGSKAYFNQVFSYFAQFLDHI